MSASPAIEVYVGLGGNVGDVRARFAAAVDAMRAWPEVSGARMSPVYESAPVGPVADQPRFCNAVVALTVDVAADPRALWQRLRALETELGRVRREPQGPREIDLDVLLFGDAVVDEPELAIPHPRMWSRAFVLRPLADLAGPDRILRGRRLADWLARVGDQDVAPATPGVPGAAPGAGYSRGD
jgi:2-amino-4-hydroxy-6-hydroxymethyldihydropteridine diphosphokinase